MYLYLFILCAGLCGLLASRFAKETYLTDYEDVVLEVLQQNVTLNNGIYFKNKH